MLRGGLTKNWSEMMELSKMLVFTMKNMRPSVQNDEVKKHVPSHSRPETDRGEAIKGSPEYDVPWLQIPPLAQLIARKQIVGRPRKWSPEYTHASENTVFSTVCFLFLFTSRFRM